MILAPTFISNLSPEGTKASLSYSNGNLHYASIELCPTISKLQFSASPDRFKVESALLKLGASALTLHADVSNYSNPIADGDYQIQIHTQDFAALSPASHSRR